MDKVIAPAKRDTPKFKKNTKNEYPNKPKTMDGIPDMECIIICIMPSIFFIFII